MRTTSTSQLSKRKKRASQLYDIGKRKDPKKIPRLTHPAALLLRAAVPREFQNVVKELAIGIIKERKGENQITEEDVQSAICSFIESLV